MPRIVGPIAELGSICELVHSSKSSYLSARHVRHLAARRKALSGHRGSRVSRTKSRGRPSRKRVPGERTRQGARARDSGRRALVSGRRAESCGCAGCLERCGHGVPHGCSDRSTDARAAFGREDYRSDQRRWNAERDSRGATKRCAALGAHQLHRRLVLHGRRWER